MKNTEYENGVLICSIHRTPISKRTAHVFCLKCQRNQDASYATGSRSINCYEREIKDLEQQRDDLLAACKATKLRIAFIGLPSEPMNEDGPDWSREVALIEAAIKNSLAQVFIISYPFTICCTV